MTNKGEKIDADERMLQNRRSAEIALREPCAFQAVHDGRLRPKLGHPQQAEHLEKLCGEEEQRFAEFVAGVEEQAVTLQASSPQSTATALQAVHTCLYSCDNNNNNKFIFRHDVHHS